MTPEATTEQSLLLRHIKFLAVEFLSLWRETYYSTYPLKQLQRLWMRVGSNYLQSAGYYLARLIPKKTTDSATDAPLSLVARIQRDGMAYLDPVAPSAVNFITFNESTARTAAEHTIDYQAAEQFARTQGFHAIAAEYLGAHRCFLDVRSWRLNANPQTEVEVQTARWHRDRDGKKVLKFFIYLSDVDTGGGEHEIAIGSTAMRPLRFVPQVRFEDAEVRRFFRCEKVSGKAGTCFVEDTSILHRGNVPKEGARDVVSITYYTGSVYWHASTQHIQLT